MYYEDISSTKCHKILQELEKYCQIKADIRYQAKSKVSQITKKKREKLLEKSKKEGKCFFFFYKKLHLIVLSRIPMPFKV